MSFSSSIMPLGGAGIKSVLLAECVNNNLNTGEMFSARVPSCQYSIKQKKAPLVAGPSIYFF